MSAETVKGDFNVSFCIIFPIIQHYIDKKQCMTVLLKVEHLILINLEKCMILFSNGMKKNIGCQQNCTDCDTPSIPAFLTRVMYKLLFKGKSIRDRIISGHNLTLTFIKVMGA